MKLSNNLLPRFENRGYKNIAALVLSEKLMMQTYVFYASYVVQKTSIWFGQADTYIGRKILRPYIYNN